jgi:hypothetical protein
VVGLEIAGQTGSAAALPQLLLLDSLGALSAPAAEYMYTSTGPEGPPSKHCPSETGHAEVSYLHQSVKTGKWLSQKPLAPAIKQIFSLF